ncbi:Nucleolar complex protein 3 [Nowakowskiella sp. JEL0407]|nr:Nucleolar complex protein 3 [Nowakowskiella sp. JEL0407]
MRKKQKLSKIATRRQEAIQKKKAQNSLLKPLQYNSDSDFDLSDEDLQFLKDYGSSVDFLKNITSTELIKNVPQTKQRPKLDRSFELPEVDSEEEGSDDLNDESELSQNELDALSDNESEEGIDEFDSDEDDEDEEMEEDEDDMLLRRKKSVERKVDDDDDSEMEEYEKAPRAMSVTRTEKPSRLPVIDKSGKIIKVGGALEVDMDTAKSVTEQNKALKAAKLAKKEARLKGKDANSNKELRKIQNKKFEEQSLRASEARKAEIDAIVDATRPTDPAELRVFLQEQLASVAAAIMEDPEANIERLKTLRKLNNEDDVFIQNVSLLTQLAVYKDIIPGYAIRELTGAERAVKVSKDVRKIRKYEDALVSGYNNFIQLLESRVMAVRNGMADKSILLEVQCLTQLMNSVSHFNFKDKIMNDVVELTNVRDPPEVCELCCEAICNVFSNDEHGSNSLELMTLLSKMIKARGYAVDERVIKTFTYLRLSEDVKKSTLEAKSNFKDKKKDKKKKPDASTYVSRKSKKLTKEQEEIEAEMKEAEAVYDKEARKKMNTETIKLVFVTYLRLLKNAQTTSLIPAVLEGLAKFAHLINVDLFSDLLSVLKQLSASQYERYKSGQASLLEARSSFHCIVAALRLMSTQGVEVQLLDLKEFCVHLYGQLMCLACDTDVPKGDFAMDDKRARFKVSEKSKGNELELEVSKNMTELAFAAFDLLFGSKKNVVIERLAAFVKRFSTVIVHLPSNAVLAGLSLIRHLLTRYPRLDSLLDHEDRMGNGTYKQTLEDPDLSNALLAGVWELHPLLNHYHPSVRKFTLLVLSTVNQSISSDGTTTNYKPLPAEFNMSPKKFLADYNWMSPPPPNASRKRKSDSEEIQDQESKRVEYGFKYIPPSNVPIQIEKGVEKIKAGGPIKIRMNFIEMCGEAQKSLHDQLLLLHDLPNVVPLAKKLRIDERDSSNTHSSLLLSYNSIVKQFPSQIDNGSLNLETPDSLFHKPTEQSVSGNRQPCSCGCGRYMVIASTLESTSNHTVSRTRQRALNAILNMPLPEKIALSETLKSLIFKVSLNELRVQAAKAPVEYYPIWESDVFTMCVFVIRKGITMPTHDHPSMTVFSKIISGDLLVKTYELQESSRKDLGVPENVHLAKVGIEKVISSSSEESLLYIHPDSGPSLHSFTAVSDSVVILDIIGPPYNEERPCTYFRQYHLPNKSTYEYLSAPSSPTPSSSGYSTSTIESNETNKKKKKRKPHKTNGSANSKSMDSLNLTSLNLNSSPSKSQISTKILDSNLPTPMHSEATRKDEIEAPNYCYLEEVPDMDYECVEQLYTGSAVRGSDLQSMESLSAKDLVRLANGVLGLLETRGLSTSNSNPQERKNT